MGRKASKAKKNIYYLARIHAAEQNTEFSSREKASERVGIERSRLARIELDKVQPYPEEILMMSKAYEAPWLCRDYCSNGCMIGLDKAVGKKLKNVKMDSFERISLKFISSSQSMEALTRRLVDISKDGKITEDEYETFKGILKAMNELSESLKEVKAFIMADPELRARFEDDLLI